MRPSTSGGSRPSWRWSRRDGSTCSRGTRLFSCPRCRADALCVSHHDGLEGELMNYATAILLACLTLVCIQVHDRLARSRNERRIDLSSKADAENLEATAKLAEVALGMRTMSPPPVHPGRRKTDALTPEHVPGRDSRVGLDTHPAPQQGRETVSRQAHNLEFRVRPPALQFHGGSSRHRAVSTEETASARARLVAAPRGRPASTKYPPRRAGHGAELGRRIEPTAPERTARDDSRSPGPSRPDGSWSPGDELGIPPIRPTSTTRGNRCRTTN